MIVRCLRRHAISLMGLVVHASLCTIRAPRVVSLAIALLVLIHICSIIWARIIRMTIRVLARLSLWLRRMCLLSLGGWTRLLILTWRVGCCMPTCLSFTSCCIPRLRLLCRALWKLAGAVRLGNIVSAIRALLGCRYSVLLSLCPWLLIVLVGIIILVCISLLVGSVVGRILAWSR
jgi:hypothetical protein